MNKLTKDEQKTLDELMKKFDWQFYVTYYDGLSQLIKNEQMAKYHFTKNGFKEGRICCKEQLKTQQAIEQQQLEQQQLEQQQLEQQQLEQHQLEQHQLEQQQLEQQQSSDSCIKIDINKTTLVYYSKTNYKLLFQRPHQIMRFFDKFYNKIFIGTIDNVQYEEKYNLWIVPYDKKKEVYKLLSDNMNIITYFTDSRLYDEIALLKGTKLFDLIDAPIDEFSVWKPNLEKCVKNADYIIYSHPELIKYLNEIDNTKTYYYVSNGCDYEHFSKAKNRIGDRPKDFPDTNKKILGYYGAFAKWLDYDVILKYASEGLYHIVMIGGILNCPSYNIRFVHPNITWLDHKSYEELPYYLSWFDVCFLPFKCCELTKYVNPCKLWEYMVSEKEIIKTNVNIDCSKIMKYEDECDKILEFLHNNLIVNCIKNYNIKNELNVNYNIEFFTRINNKYKNNKLINDELVIIGFSMIDYFFRVQRSQHLLRLCSENGYKVFYLRTKINNKTKDVNVKEIYPNLYEIDLWCETDRNISVYSTNLTLNEINSLIECINYIKITFGFKHFTSYIANPFWLQVVKYINNTSIVFDCLDYTKGFNTHSELILKLEDEIIQKEYIIYTSLFLKELTNCNHNNYSYIKNACDFNYFNKIINNKNYEKKRKIVGYYGAISDWWDVELVEQVVKQFQDIDFHFIGNIYCNNLSHTKKINDLKSFPNVTFFGEIPYDKLDIYISKFDIGIIPFIINDLIRCTNPVKLYEMFSFGIPVVLTKLPDVLTLEIDNLCYISKNVDEFIENIKSALIEETLNNNVVNERIEYSKQNCWKNRFELLNKVINTIMPKISIILLCWNNWSTTEKCINSVLENSNYLFYELIIVNNNSTDETYNQLETSYKNIPNIKIVHNKENYGFAMGMNIGALNASYEYIILLNNDTIVGNDWLYPLVKPLILNDYGIGTPITNNCGNEVKQFIYFTDIDDLMQKSGVLQKHNNFKTCEIDRIPFFCPVLRKKDFFAVGMLDINYKFGGWEDDDIIHKLKIYNNNKQNYYTFGSFVYHIESLSMSQITKTINWTHNNNNKQYFENKWNTIWVPPKYYIQNININIETNIKWIHNLITDAKISGKAAFTLCSNKENKETIIIKDKIPDVIQDNEIIITTNKENLIVLSNKNNSLVLTENLIIQLYSFINTTLFYKNQINKIKYFKIYGERNSGTSIITEYLKQNLKITELESCYSHKHFFGFNNYGLETNCILFISIVRDPISWINSFFQNPYHIPKENLININTFLFNEFYSIYDNGEIIHEDLNYNTKNKYKNIFEMRYFKNNYLLNILPKKIKNYYFLKFEDFIQNPEKVLNNIINKFNLITNNSIINNNMFLYEKGDTNSKIIKTQKDKILNTEIIQIIKSNLNFEQEHQLGYL